MEDLNNDGVVDEKDEMLKSLADLDSPDDTETEPISREELLADLELLDREGKGPEELTVFDKLRLIGQGFTFDWSDEAIARIKSLSPSLTYEDSLAYEREQNKIAREKPGSFKYEVGGAILPSVAAAPFTAGGSVGITAARLAAIGAAQGLASGTGRSEREGFESVIDAPVDVALGAVLNPALAKLGQKTIAAITPLFTSIKERLPGKVGKKVEDELIRIIADGGLTVDEVIEKINAGEIIPEMSDEAATAVAGFARQAGPGAGIITETLEKRRSKFTKDVFDSFTKDLAPNQKTANIYETFSNNEKDLLKKESQAYNKIFKSEGSKTYDQISEWVLNHTKDRRASRNLINKYMDVKGRKPLFKINKKTKELELTRELTLEDGEIIKRAFMDVRGGAIRQGNTDLATTFAGYENNIKKIVDELSPDLKQTRYNWANIKQLVDNYKEGEKAFKTDPEMFEIFFNKILSDGKPDQIEAVRTGVAKALKRRSQSARKISTVGAMTDTKDAVRAERVILEIIYPGESFDGIVRKMNQMMKTIKAESLASASKGSKTAPIEEASKRVGVKSSLANLARTVASGGTDLPAVRSVIGGLFPDQNAPKFTDEELVKISELIIEENSDIIKKALTDETAIEQLGLRISSLVNRLVGTGFGASQPRTEAITSIPGIDMVRDLISGMTDATREKVISSTEPR